MRPPAPCHSLAGPSGTGLVPPQEGTAISERPCCFTGLPDSGPSSPSPCTCGSPDPSPPQAWPRFGLGPALGLAPAGGSLSLCHLLGTPQCPLAGRQCQAPYALPRASSLQLPHPPDAPQSPAAPASCAHREFEDEAMRQELAALLSSVQLLREGNPGRKIAEIQGKLATVPLGPWAWHTGRGAVGGWLRQGQTSPNPGRLRCRTPPWECGGRGSWNQPSCWVALHISASGSTKLGLLSGAPRC